RRCILGCQSPILRGSRKSPHIAVGIECRTNQKFFALGAKWQTISHPRGNASAAWKIAQHDRSFKLQGMGAAKAASLGADDHHHTLLRKGTHPVQTRYANRNLDTDATAAPGHLRRHYLHHCYLKMPACGADNSQLTSVTDWEIWRG